MHTLEVIVVLIIIFISTSFKRVPKEEEWIIKDFGRMRRSTLKPGIHFLLPFVSRVKLKVFMEEQKFIKHMPVFSKDKVVIDFKIIIVYQIVDPIKMVCVTDNIQEALKLETEKILKKVVWKMNWREVLNIIDKINNQLIRELKYVSKDFGCDVKTVGINDANVPQPYVSNLQEEMDMFLKNRNVKSNETNSNEDNEDNIRLNNWIKSFKKSWETKDLEEIMALFDNNVEYYKDYTTRLYSLYEIKEEWKEILENDYDKINMNIEMQDGESSMISIILESRMIENLIVKIKLNQNNKCTYFKIME